MSCRSRNPLRTLIRRIFAQRTRALLYFDLHRLRARWSHPHCAKVVPHCDKLHFGCGGRRVERWLNVDMHDSEYDVDLAFGRLPWQDRVFSAIVGQQVIEHLELHTECIPLFKELDRVAKRGAQIWLSCPDMEKVCRSYLHSRGADVLEDRLTRCPDFSLQGAPVQHVVNDLFHQGGEHKNLFDFELLQWAMEQGGFRDCRRVNEAEMLRRFPEFPARNDDSFSLYVTAVAP